MTTSQTCVLIPAASLFSRNSFVNLSHSLPFNTFALIRCLSLIDPNTLPLVCLSLSFSCFRWFPCIPKPLQMLLAPWIDLLLMAELEYARFCLIYFSLIPVARTCFTQCLSNSLEWDVHTYMHTQSASIIINDFFPRQHLEMLEPVSGVLACVDRF